MSHPVQSIGTPLQPVLLPASTPKMATALMDLGQPAGSIQRSLESLPATRGPWPVKPAVGSSPTAASEAPALLRSALRQPHEPPQHTRATLIP